MTIRILTDEEYEALKKKLHQAHDKMIKLALQDEEASEELIGKVIAPLLPTVQIDLTHLILDNTTYVHPNLEVFFLILSI